MNQVNDSEIQSEGLTGTSDLSSVKDNLDKKYTDTADDLGEDIYNYDDSSRSNDSIYGDY